MVVEVRAHSNSVEHCPTERGPLEDPSVVSMDTADESWSHLVGRGLNRLRIDFILQSIGTAKRR